MDRISLRQEGQHGYEDSDALNALADSISRNGLIQAITVQPTADGRYVIVSGNRRFRACRMAGMRSIEAVVLESRAQDDAAQALLDRLARERMDYLAQAALMRELRERYQVPVQTIARQLRESEQTVENRMRLADLDADTAALIQKEQLPERMAQALLRVPEAEGRFQVAQRAVRDGLSIGEVEMLATSARTRLPVTPEGHGQTIGAVRDGRLYLNALRTIVGQMREAGFTAELEETNDGRTITLSVSVSARRRRAGRHRSQSSQAIQCVSYMSHSPTG